MEAFSDNYAKDLLQKLNEQRLSGDRKLYCDVVFKKPASSPPLTAHISVLASCSKFFKALWEKKKEDAEPVENKNDESENDKTNKKMMSILLPGITSGQLEHVLNYMYTGKVVVNESNVKAILVASTLLQIEGLRDICCKYICKTMRKNKVKDEVKRSRPQQPRDLTPQVNWANTTVTSPKQSFVQKKSGDNEKDRTDFETARSHGFSEILNPKNRISTSQQHLRTTCLPATYKPNNCKPSPDVVFPRPRKRPFYNPLAIHELVRKQSENNHKIRHGNNPPFTENVRNLINFHHLCESRSVEVDKQIPTKRMKSDYNKTLPSYVTDHYNPQIATIAPGMFVNNCPDQISLNEALPRYGIHESMLYERQLLALRLNWPDYMTTKSIHDVSTSRAHYMIDPISPVIATNPTVIQATLEANKLKPSPVSSPKTHAHVRKMKLLSSLNYEDYSPKRSPMQGPYNSGYAGKFGTGGEESDDSGRPCST